MSKKLISKLDNKEGNDLINLNTDDPQNQDKQDDDNNDEEFDPLFDNDSEDEDNEDENNDNKDDNTVITNKPKKKKANKQTQQEKNNNIPLKISERRRLAYKIFRTFENNKSIVERLIKYFVTEGFLYDPVKQNLIVDYKIVRESNQIVTNIEFNTDDPINQSLLVQQIKAKLNNNNLKISNNLKSKANDISINFISKMQMSASGK